MFDKFRVSNSFHAIIVKIWSTNLINYHSPIMWLTENNFYINAEIDKIFKIIKNLIFTFISDLHFNLQRYLNSKTVILSIFMIKCTLDLFFENLFCFKNTLQISPRYAGNNFEKK